jgi:proteic killer suppression protein
VIKSFKHKGLKRFTETGDRSKLSVQNIARIERILARLDVAQSPDEMNLPGWRFHALKGELAGRYAVDASGNWRITFAFDGQDAVAVDLEDYH